MFSASSLKQKFDSSFEYFQLLSDKFSQEFKDQNFGASNIQTINESTTSYFQTYNYLFIIEKEIKEPTKFYLWGLSLDPKETIVKNGLPFCKRFPISLVDENNEEWRIPKNLSLQILDNSNFYEEFLLLYGGPYIFGTFLILTIKNIF
jgi:hypothetical protein